MRIAICDDDPRDIERIRKSIQSHRDNHEVAEFLSPESIIKQLYSGEHYDLLFLDIQMPGYDGWEIAKELKNSKYKVFVAMVTVLEQYIYRCFDRVDWFAAKPVSEEMVWEIIDKAKEFLYPVAFEFKKDNLTITLTAPEIVYLEVIRNRLIIHATKESHEIRMSLRKAEAIFAEYPRFVKIGANYIINLDHYNGINDGKIRLKSQDVFTLSRNYRKPFFKALERYIRGE